MVVPEDEMKKQLIKLEKELFPRGKQPWWLDELKDGLEYLVSDDFDCVLPGDSDDYAENALLECLQGTYDLICDIGKRCISTFGEYKAYRDALNFLKNIDSHDLTIWISAAEDELDEYLDRQLNPAKYVEIDKRAELPF